MWQTITISSKNNNCGAVIFEAVIEAPDENVLDLDDNRQPDEFLTESLKFVEDITRNCLGRMPIFEDSQFRAVFFDYYKTQNKISVIIGTFHKEFAGYTIKRSESEKLMQHKIMDVIGIKFNERQICVSPKECIKATKLVYNEEEEVK